MRLIRLQAAMIVRERRLALALGVVAAVLATSGLVTSIASEQARQARASVSARERERWLGQGERDPHSAAHQSIYAFKPVLPLAAVDPGIEPFVGETVWLEAHVQNDLLNRPMQESTTSGRAGLVDPAGLFLRFAPLVVFLLATGAAARDREQGTLALALSLAPSGRSVAAVKAMAIALLSSAALVGPLAAIGLAGMALGGTDGDAPLRLMLWMLAALVYIVLLTLTGVVVALRSRSQMAAFGQLLLIWIVAVVAAPLAASVSADHLEPLPSFQAMKIQLEHEVPAYWTAEVGAERRSVLLERYGALDEADLEERRVNLRGLELDYAERLAQAAFDREIGAYYRQAVAQDRVYGRLGWLSPAVAFDAASSGLAGTDFVHHLSFMQAAERYRRALVNRMNADLIPNPSVNGIVHTRDNTLWTQVDAFEYAPPGWREGWHWIATPLMALGTWLVGVTGFFWWTTARLRP
jgi:ABC-2 type transport system permease protein